LTGSKKHRGHSPSFFLCHFFSYKYNTKEQEKCYYKKTFLSIHKTGEPEPKRLLFTAENAEVFLYKMFFSGISAVSAVHLFCQKMAVFELEVPIFYPYKNMYNHK